MKLCAASVLIAFFLTATLSCLAAAPASAQSVDSKRKSRSAVERNSDETEESAKEAQKKLFKMSSEIPVLEKAVDPDSYVLGPYDRLAMTIMGMEPRTYVLGVLPEGDVIVPGIGPIRADGLTLTEFRRALAAEVDKYFRNIELYCYLETPALFRVFVTGEVENPGVVAVSGVERVVDAIEKAGSVKKGGSLRAITLGRGGASIRVDLFRFLDQGDLKDNPFLRSGDRIHVPPAEWHAAIAGRVHKPSGYEIIEGETIADLVALAGGFAAEAIEDSVLLKRVSSLGEVTMTNVARAHLDRPLRDGDEIGVYDGLKDRRYVTVSGATMRTGQFELARGEGVSNLIVRAGGFKPLADLTAAYLARKGSSVVKLDLKEYLSPEPAKDLPLENGDELTIPVYRDEGHRRRRGEPAGRVPVQRRSQRRAIHRAGGGRHEGRERGSRHHLFAGRALAQRKAGHARLRRGRHRGEEIGVQAVRRFLPRHDTAQHLRHIAHHSFQPIGAVWGRPKRT